jgi:hypothetical protein
MGLFCVNLHFQTSDQSALEAALDHRGVDAYRVLSPKNGWTSLYEERASQQDEKRIHDLAGKLTKDLHVPCVAFLVHDSDIACYWLFVDGLLQDEYNSCPDYFGDGENDESSGPSGGRTDVLLPYCRSGVRQDELAAILNGENLFAEAIIEQLAAALGIEPERAIADFKDFENGEWPYGEGGPDGDGPDGDKEDNGPDEEGGHGRPNVLPFRADMMGQLEKMFRPNSSEAKVDPNAAALVEAASKGDLAAIERLLAEGVAVDAEAPGPHPGSQEAAGLGQFIPGGMPKFPMSSLLAAILHKQQLAAERLLIGGADPDRVNPLFGSAMHVAAGAGDSGLLKMLIDRGGDVCARNAQGQTPLEVVAAGRATLDKLAKVQAMMKSMGTKLPPGILDQAVNVKLPLEGWDACEQLLKAKMNQ